MNSVGHPNGLTVRPGLRLLLLFGVILLYHVIDALYDAHLLAYDSLKLLDVLHLLALQDLPIR